MKTEFENKPWAAMAASSVAWAAAIFALILAVLLIGDFLRQQSLDPLNHTELVQMRQDLADGAEVNPKLVGQIRAFDLLARRSYFASQAQRGLGGVLLLVSVVILLAALKCSSIWRRPLPEIGGQAEDLLELQQKRRHLLAGFGLLLVVLALVASFSSRSNIPASKALQQAAEQDLSDPSDESDPSDKAAPLSFAEMQTQWPSFRGPGSIGVAGTTYAPLKWDVLWKKELPVPGFNSPVIWGEHLFLSGSEEANLFVLCYNTVNGDLRWKKQVTGLPGSPAEPPEVAEDTGYAAATMCTDGQRAFAIFASGDLACFDFDGNMLWGRNLGVPDNPYGHASSLLTDGLRLFVQYDQRDKQQLFALDNASGKELWRVPDRTHVSWASPALIETEFGRQLLLNSEENIDSYDPATGKLLWSHNCLGGEVAPSPAYNNGLIFVANEYAQATALKLTETGVEALWEYDDYLPEIASPVISDKYCYIPTTAGDIVCLDRGTGEALWEEEFEDGFNSSPILVGDRLYAIDLSGNVYVIADAAEYTLLGTNTMDEGVHATIAVLNGRIYVRGETHLFCIGEAP